MRRHLESRHNNKQSLYTEQHVSNSSNKANLERRSAIGALHHEAGRSASRHKQLDTTATAPQAEIHLLLLLHGHLVGERDLRLVVVEGLLNWHIPLHERLLHHDLRSRHLLL